MWVVTDTLLWGGGGDGAAPGRTQLGYKVKLSYRGCQGVLEVEQGTIVAQGAPHLCSFSCQSWGTDFHLLSVLWQIQELCWVRILGVWTQTHKKWQSRVYLTIYIYIYFLDQYIRFLTCFFLHKQKNSDNSRLSKINTIKIELQNKYSIQRKPSVVTFVVGWEGATVKRQHEVGR